jgi:hypothetical protein
MMDLKDVCPVRLWLEAWTVATDEGTVEMISAVKIVVHRLRAGKYIVEKMRITKLACYLFDVVEGCREDWYLCDEFLL